MNQDILAGYSNVVSVTLVMSQGCKACKTTDTQRLLCMVASRVNGAEEGQRKDGLTQLEATARR